jgi:hypothetical protein
VSDLRTCPVAVIDSVTSDGVFFGGETDDGTRETYIKNGHAWVTAGKDRRKCLRCGAVQELQGRWWVRWMSVALLPS